MQHRLLQKNQQCPSASIRSFAFRPKTNIALGSRCSRNHRQTLPSRVTAIASDGSDFDQGLNRDEARTVPLSDAERAIASKVIKEEQERLRAITPFMVAPPNTGIIGNSRYAAALRKQVHDAAFDLTRCPVLVFGEPGLQKDNIATLIHYGSKRGRNPMLKIDCERLDDNASELFGANAKKGLLSYLRPDYTLLLNNVHLTPKAALPLIKNILYCSKIANSDSATVTMSTIDIVDDLLGGDPSCSRFSHPRIIMTAETRVPELETSIELNVIKVPPLRVRPSDIEALTKFYLRKIARQRGLPELRITPGALKRLESAVYAFNVEELKAAIEKGVTQSVQVSTTQSSDRAVDKPVLDSIGEEVFWFESGPSDRYKMDLFKAIPMLRQFARSDFWPEKLNFQFVVYAYYVVVLILFVGPQDRQHNFALNAFWDYWWPLIFIAYPFLGRIWCSFCPFMITGEIVQRWRKSQGYELLKWPKQQMEQYGGLFLLTLFGAILVWEETYDLPNTAALSSWLLLIITAGAVVCSFFFEKRLWCRYLCPIGGMNSLFSKLAMTELRARQGVCSAECDTYHCYKGGPAEPPEGLETNGCPLGVHPAQLESNKDCVLCMDCVKACPHKSVEFRWRLPAADLWSGHKPQAFEASVMWLLMGAVYLHHLPQLLGDVGIASDPITSDLYQHILVSIIVLGIPGAVAFGVDSLWRGAAAVASPSSWQFATDTAGAGADTTRAIEVLQRATSNYEARAAGSVIVAPKKSFLELSYAYLPVVWAGTLAHYLDPLLSEAGNILPVAAETFGFHAPWLPTFAAHPAVITALQGTLLLFGEGCGLILTRRIAADKWVHIVPQCLVITLLTAELWHVILK